MNTAPILEAEAPRVTQMPEISRERAMHDRAERGYQTLGWYTVTFHKERAASRLPIGDRIREVARDLDAVMRAHGMKLADVLDK